MSNDTKWKTKMKWWWLIYDFKQKHPSLHTSERTIVPRTVIFIDCQQYTSFRRGNHWQCSSNDEISGFSGDVFPKTSLLSAVHLCTVTILIFKHFLSICTTGPAGFVGEILTRGDISATILSRVTGRFSVCPSSCLLASSHLTSEVSHLFRSIRGTHHMFYPKAVFARRSLVCGPSGLPHSVHPI